MKMSDIKIIRIVTGPGQVAYDFEGGELTVWLGDYAESAPRKALVHLIPAGSSSWSIEESRE